MPGSTWNAFRLPRRPVSPCCWYNGLFNQKGGSGGRLHASAKQSGRSSRFSGIRRQKRIVSPSVGRLGRKRRNWTTHHHLHCGIQEGQFSTSPPESTIYCEGCRSQYPSCQLIYNGPPRLPFARFSSNSESQRSSPLPTTKPLKRFARRDRWPARPVLWIMRIRQRFRSLLHSIPYLGQRRNRRL